MNNLKNVNNIRVTIVKGFLLCLIIFTSACSNPKEDLIYLTPYNYQGNVYIIFDNTSSPKNEKKGRTTTIHIPENGVLFTPEVSSKKTNIRFYYEKSDLSRHELLRAGKSNNDKNTYYLFNPSYGVYGSSNTPCHYRYFSFIVGKVNEDKNYFRIGDYLKEKIKRCKGLNENNNTTDKSDFKNHDGNNAFDKLKEKFNQ